MPYIPQFNKLSMAEMAYAPTLMRQQHDEAIAKQMELADALKFDYLKQDASILEPVLNKYSEDIQKVSTDLAKNGFTQDTKSKLLELRSQYTGDDKIRNIKSRYADAMQGWEERKKSLLQQKASGEDINAMRKAYFAGITPAYDEEGFKQDLTPGATSSVYDISEDIKNKFANIGSTEVVYGGSGVKAVREILGKGTPYERSAWKILDSTGGTKANNLSQREAVKALTLSEYTDPSSDRALYAKLTNKSPEYISGLIDQWSDAMAKNDIGQVAQTRGSYEFDKEKEAQPGGGFTPYTYSDGSGNPDVTERTDGESSILNKPIPTELSQSEKSKIAEGVSRGGGVPNQEYLKSLHSKRLAEKQQELVNEKKKVVSYYSNIYKDYYNNLDPIEATKKAIETERNNNAMVVRRTAVDVDKKELGGVGSTQKVLSRIKAGYDGYVITKQDKNTSLFSKNGYKTPQDFINSVKDNTGWDDQAIEVDNNADIMIKDKDNKLVKIEPNALQDDVAQIQQNVLKPILQDATNPALFNGQQKVVILPNTNIKYKVIPRPQQSQNDRPDLYNIKDRMVEMYVEDPSTGQKVHSQVISIPDFKSELVRGMFQGFEPTSLGK